MSIKQERFDYKVSRFQQNEVYFTELLTLQCEASSSLIYHYLS